MVGNFPHVWAFLPYSKCYRVIITQMGIRPTSPISVFTETTTVLPGSAIFVIEFTGLVPSPKKPQQLLLTSSFK